ncbi:extracellular solute-binding protein [Novosphingobium sp. MW5]|nr:extracellular solute-binding protein [Novosphingobium sp. MW5]
MDLKSVVLASSGLVAMATGALADQVELDLWTIDDPGEYHYVMADEFMAKHPDIKINVRTVQFEDMVNDLARGVATGDAPDITYIDNPEVALFASRDLLLDLRPYIEKSEIVDADDIFPGPLASVTYEGGIFGIPRGANAIALYYNADMFREAGARSGRSAKHLGRALRGGQGAYQTARECLRTGLLGGGDGGRHLPVPALAADDRRRL